jgi:transposase-like protein
MKKRREYSPEYKSKLVIEVLREEKTLSEIASRENINIKQLSNWKSEFLENAARAFSRSRDEKAAAQQVKEMKDRERDYQAKVGQLTLEVDFLKGVHEKLHGPGWEDIIGFKK